MKVTIKQFESDKEFVFSGDVLWARFINGRIEVTRRQKNQSITIEEFENVQLCFVEPEFETVDLSGVEYLPTAIGEGLREK